MASAVVLVVDDDEQARREYREFLSAENYRVIEAGDGQQAISLVNRERPDLVILDMVMPRLDGLAVCRMLKGRPELGFLPVIIVTAHGDVDNRVQALKLGADDYISKPANRGELLARVEALLRIKNLQDNMSDSLRQAEDQALLDQQTGLYNQRYLQRRLADEYKRAQRHSEPLSILLIETDTPFLPAKRCADILRRCVREYDVICRLDEERYAVLLPRTHFTGALSVASRIWKSMAGGMKVASKQVPVNIGASFFPNKDINGPEDLLEQAQTALYKARNSPEGRICLFQHTTYYYRPDMGQ